MKDVIRLQSRDGTPNLLRKVEDTEDCHSYTLVTPYNYRMGETTDGMFIDPSGGPFLTKGSLVGDYVVKEVRIDDKEGPVIVLE